MKALLACVLAGGLALSAATVQANAVQFQSSLTDLKLNVIDLTPDDGIDAGFRYQSIEASYSLILDLPGQPPETIRESTDGGPVEFELSEGASSIALSAGTLGNLTITGSVTRNGTWFTDAYGWLRQTYRLVLAPNTAVTLTGYLHQSVTRNGPGDRGDLTSALRYRTLDYRRNGAFDHDTTWAGPGAATHDQDIYFAFANPGDEDEMMSLDIYLSSSGRIATAVPEPATVALLLAGMFVVGTAAWRTRGVREGF